MKFPRMFLAERKRESPRIGDVRQAIVAEMQKLNLHSVVRPGMRVAVTAGSRGITDNVLILATVVSELKRYGADPFVIPAMGSHGGATAEGQLGILKALGITEETMECPIISQMEVVQLGHTPEGIPVYIDKVAASADGIVVVNRIKPHTEYKGEIESGLLKMMAIGLGKHKGGYTTHSYAVQLGYQIAIPAVGRHILKEAPILFGLGVVENAYDETAIVAAVEPGLFEETDQSLLKKAKEFLPRLPFEKIDILVVDEMGKEISGTGIDTNIIGRVMFVGGPEPEWPKIIRIVVLDLTDKTCGSALGMGLADFVTRRLVNKIDFPVTYVNCFTAMTPEKGRVPPTGETDREAIEWAFQTIGAVEPQDARVVKIKNTLHLDKIYISQSLATELKSQPDWEIEDEACEMCFSKEGTLLLGN
jgi:hypothetical protein